MVSDLSHALSDTMTDELSSVISNLSEAGLDAIMHEGILKEIPFLSTAISLYKIGQSIHDRHYIRKLILFLDALNAKTVSDEERKRHRRRLNINPPKSNAEIEYLLLIIDRFIELDKPPLLAKLYLAYLDERIDWNELTQYSVIIDRCLPGDLQLLSKKRVRFLSYRSISASCLRLVAQGLMAEYVHDPRIDGQTQSSYDTIKKFEITDFGERLIHILS